jgi:DNA (cytosine-5)-methyltransferase 1
VNRPLTLGSLFDGSGGFPLGAVLRGIRPVWASEIEPFAIRVTTKRFPHMRHLGDITGINGAKAEPVDIITFGSPCTDMSVAGRRAGLDGDQSVLFYQAIRIIQEMRRATNGRYPRYIVWENVPGAFSSNRGADFKAVIDAVTGIAAPGAQVPAPDGNGWPYADVLLGDGWSVAYRTLDAQYFGVAQRRKRIYLVADFGSERAGEILFEREGVRRNFAPCFPAGEGTAGGAAAGAGGAGGGNRAVAFEPGAASRKGGHCWDELSGTLRADAGDNQAAVVYDARGTHACNQGGIAVCVQGSLVGREQKNGPRGSGVNEETAFTLNTADRHAVAYAMTMGGFAEFREEQVSTLMARDYKDPQAVAAQPHYIVRRLTPRECALLQGFPSGWCAGLETPEPAGADIAFWSEVWETHRKVTGTSSKPRSRGQIVKWLRNPHSDAAEYKLWGNGVALPCVCFVMAGIVTCTQD